MKIIGKISANVQCPSTIDSFYFWTDPQCILSPFDAVKVVHEEDSVTYGVIEEIYHTTDAANHFTNYISSNFGELEEDCSIGNMHRLGMNYVKVKVLWNTKNILTPVLNGSLVSLCDDANEIRRALGLNEVKNPLVCGYLQMYHGKDARKVKVELNSKFLIGPEGAHINISGISGLAAKTSYSMFMLRALQQKCQHSEGEKIAYVIFNVKGRDLMAIDERTEDLSPEDEQIYKELGLETTPFENVKYYYPYAKPLSISKKQPNACTYADIEDMRRQMKAGKAYQYVYTYEKTQDTLDLLLANEDDGSGTMESCINFIMDGKQGFRGIERWESLRDALDKCTQAGANKNSEISVASWRKFKRCINKTIRNEIFAEQLNESSYQKDLSSVIESDLKGGEVMVIDIAKLDPTTQSFVFGSVARAIYEMKLGATRQDVPDKVIIFVDELNKYASTDVPKSSPILKCLLDIAERGRSLGIILFSVEQFRSAIHERVKGNCATHAYGRSNSTELAKKDYSSVPKTYLNMITRMSPGEYIISNPALRSLLKIRFPHPLYKQFPNA